MARVAERRVTENEDIGFKLLNKKVSSSDRENKATRTIEECQGKAGEHEVGRDSPNTTRGPQRRRSEQSGKG